VNLLVVVPKNQVDTFCPARVSGGTPPEIMRHSGAAGPQLMIRTSGPSFNRPTSLPQGSPADRKYDSLLFFKNKSVCASLGAINLPMTLNPMDYGPVVVRA
jgi:hypothetical protein